MINSNDLVERSCPNCGTTYKASAQRLKHGRQTTCSRACSYEYRANQIQKQVELVCATCEKNFSRAQSTVKSKHGAVFCSPECQYKGRTLGKTKRIVEKPYVYTPEGKAAQIASSSKPKGKRTWHMLTCENCKKPFDDPRDGRKRISGIAFCSLDCCNTYRKGENNPSWRGGYDKYYGPDWRPLQKAARNRDNYSCRRCGKDMNKPSRAPDVHHIKPVSSFENPNDANTIDNVVCLCHVCHMYVEWHGMDFSL